MTICFYYTKRVRLGGTPTLIAGTPNVIAGIPTIIAGIPMISVLLVIRFRYLKNIWEFKDSVLQFIHVGVAFSLLHLGCLN